MLWNRFQSHGMRLPVRIQKDISGEDSFGYGFEATSILLI